jgi:hypothetical protein
VDALRREARAAVRDHPIPADPVDTMPDLERHR